MNSKVSLITPCYNGEKYLLPFLKSIESQNINNLEFFFVDDGSCDKTKEIFMKWKSSLEKSCWDIQYLLNSHKGQSEAISLALPLITGDYLIWADSDDILLKDAITTKVNFLESNPEFDMVRNDAYLLDNNSGKIIGKAIRNDEKKNTELFYSLILGQTSCLAGTYMIRKQLIQKIYPSGKIPFSKQGQNLQMLLPATSYSKCGFIDIPLLIYRIHNGSHSNHKRTFREQLERIQQFYKLLLDLLPYCNVDKDYYKKLANLYKENEIKRLIKSVAKRSRK